MEVNMGMHVSSVANNITPQTPGNAGGPTNGPAVGFTGEKKAPLPGEKIPAGQSEDKPKTPDLKQTTRELEQISMALNRRMKFEINQESREILIKVIDNETDKVIKVIPPEELQRLHSRIRETLGFLFDQRV